MWQHCSSYGIHTWKGEPKSASSQLSLVAMLSPTLPLRTLMVLARPSSSGVLERNEKHLWEGPKNIASGSPGRSREHVVVFWGAREPLGNDIKFTLMVIAEEETVTLQQSTFSNGKWLTSLSSAAMAICPPLGAEDMGKALCFRAWPGVKKAMTAGLKSLLTQSLPVLRWSPAEWSWYWTDPDLAAGQNYALLQSVGSWWESDGETERGEQKQETQRAREREREKFKEKKPILTRMLSWVTDTLIITDSLSRWCWTTVKWR